MLVATGTGSPHLHFEIEENINGVWKSVRQDFFAEIGGDISAGMDVTSANHHVFSRAIDTFREEWTALGGNPDDYLGPNSYYPNGYFDCASCGIQWARPYVRNDFEGENHYSRNAYRVYFGALALFILDNVIIT